MPTAPAVAGIGPQASPPRIPKRWRSGGSGGPASVVTEGAGGVVGAGSSADVGSGSGRGGSAGVGTRGSGMVTVSCAATASTVNTTTTARASASQSGSSSDRGARSVSSRATHPSPLDSMVTAASTLASRPASASSTQACARAWSGQAAGAVHSRLVEPTVSTERSGRSGSIGGTRKTPYQRPALA